MNNTGHQIQDDSLLNGVPYQAGRESTRKSMNLRERFGRWAAGQISGQADGYFFLPRKKQGFQPRFRRGVKGEVRGRLGCESG
jgi:hypothetical protein